MLQFLGVVSIYFEYSVMVFQAGAWVGAFLGD